MKTEEMIKNMMADVAAKNAEIELLSEDVESLRSKNRSLSQYNESELTDAFAIFSQVKSVSNFTKMNEKLDLTKHLELSEVAQMVSFLSQQGGVASLSENLAELAEYQILGTPNELSIKLSDAISPELVAEYSKSHAFMTEIGGIDVARDIHESTDVLISKAGTMLSLLEVDSMDEAITTIDQMQRIGEEIVAKVTPYQSIDTLTKIADMTEQLVAKTKRSKDTSIRTKLIEKLNASRETIDWMDDLHESEGMSWNTIKKVAAQAIERNPYKGSKTTGLKFLLSKKDDANINESHLDDKARGSHIERSTLQNLFKR